MELIRNYPSNKAYCEKYEYTHKGLLQKLALTEIYTVGAYEEPFIQYRAAEGREKEALEDYLDAKKKVYLLEHHINGMDDAQMQAVAVSLIIASSSNAASTYSGIGSPQATSTIFTSSSSKA